MATEEEYGLDLAEWSIDGGWLYVAETESEYPYAIQISAIESVTMNDDGEVVITTINNEYTSAVTNPRRLIEKLAGRFA